MLVMRTGAMDALRIPVAPLDVLARQLVATCAGDDWNVDELLALVRSTQPYRELPRKYFLRPHEGAGAGGPRFAQGGDHVGRHDSGHGKI